MIVCFFTGKIIGNAIFSVWVWMQKHIQPAIVLIVKSIIPLHTKINLISAGDISVDSDGLVFKNQFEGEGWDKLL